MTLPLPQNCYDIETLRQCILAGAKAKYTCFWGHTPARDNRVTAACLSQWFRAPFSIAGRTYPTAEHYMMAEKARLFGDAKAEAKILAASEPGAAKAFGRAVTGFTDDVWERARTEVAVSGNRAKFAQNPELSGFLQSTSKRVLVEASPVDRIWGIGLEAADAHATDPLNWQGLNLLGFALMKVRDEALSA